jgi:hypothetical protein
MGGRSVADKVLAIVFPITAFVTMGFEHLIANMFFLLYALALGGFGDIPLLAGSVRNRLVVTGGNILGGTVLVAGVYWLAYLRSGAGVPDTLLSRHSSCSSFVGKDVATPGHLGAAEPGRLFRRRDV